MHRRTSLIYIKSENVQTLIDYVEHEVNKSTIPSFYILPKIHKQGTLKGRPITAAHSAPTTSISKILLHYLLEIYKEIPPTDISILKNTAELVYILKDIPLSKIKKYYLVVIDIESLYPNKYRLVQQYSLVLKCLLEEFLYKFLINSVKESC
jgi:hypothetical protein